MRSFFYLSLVIILFLLACTEPLKTESVQSETFITPASDQPIEKYLDKDISIIGIADSSKGGEATLRGDNFYLNVNINHNWPSEIYGKKLLVKGHLIKTRWLNVFIQDPDKPSLQGISVPPGTDLEEASQALVLLHPTWSLAE